MFAFVKEPRHVIRMHWLTPQQAHPALDLTKSEMRKLIAALSSEANGVGRV